MVLLLQVFFLTMAYFRLLIFITCSLLFACSSKKQTPHKQEPVAFKSDTVIERVVLNISDSFLSKQTVLYMKDSASTTDGINKKLDIIFNKSIPEIAKKSNIEITGPPMAWYLKVTPYYSIEAGFPVKSLPKNLPKQFHSKSIGGDTALVAQFYGPYSGTSVAYEALSEKMKSRKLKAGSRPYEIYVGKPYDKNGKRINPYRVETDIVFPIRK